MKLFVLILSALLIVSCGNEKETTTTANTENIQRTDLLEAPEGRDFLLPHLKEVNLEEVTYDEDIYSSIEELKKMTEEFKILTPREHIRARPSIYVGTPTLEETERFVMGNWKKVTYVPALSKIIDEIIDNSLAYVVNGSVYFDVKKYMETHEYGTLSGRKVDELLEQTRDNLEGGNEKRFFADFAIWKKANPETIMKWNSPWGVGVPGWHLECSVMSTKYLGKEFDIHGGGMDLKFPHHECEIAQSVGADGVSPVKYWMHGNMLTVNGTKMSKSLGNSFLPEELIAGDHPLLEKGFSQMVIRFFMLQSHYSSTLDLSSTAIAASEKGFEKLMTAISTLDSIKPSVTSSVDINGLKIKFEDAMNDDFNTPILISHLFEGVKFINSIQAGNETISDLDLIQLKTLINN